MSSAAREIKKTDAGWPKVGTERHGAAGGAPNACSTIVGKSTSYDLAQEMGCTQEEAAKWLDTFGRVVQSRLLDGHPIGIPFFGCLYVDRHRVSEERRQRKLEAVRFVIRKLTARKKAGLPPQGIRSLDHLIKMHRAKEAAIMERRLVCHIKMRMSQKMTAFYGTNSNFYANFEDIVREMSQSQFAERNGKRSTSRMHLRWSHPNADNPDEKPRNHDHALRDHLIAFDRQQHARKRYAIA